MAKTDLPPARFHDLLRYDPHTGLFHWKIRTKGRGGLILPGDVAGTDKDGCVNIKVDGVLYRAHRLAWWVMTGVWIPPSQDIDHKNRIRSDNRWDNLRLATRTQNNMNAALRTNNRSGHRGISWRRDIGKWHARIKVSGRVILLGNFGLIEDAVAARAAAEKEHLGAHSHPKRSKSPCPS